MADDDEVAGQKGWWEMKSLQGIPGRRHAAVAIMLAEGLFALGLSQIAPGQQNTPPARAERLSSVDGEVELTQNGEILTSNALANTPLFEGARVTTGKDGRAEIQFEDGSVARIPPDCSLTLAVLKPGGDAEIDLDSGMGYFELQGARPDTPMRVRFGSYVATPTGLTVLRIQLDEAPGTLAVFDGNVRLTGPGGLVVDVHGGESVKLDAAAPDRYELAESIEPDSWDAWNSDRDQALNAEQDASTAATQSTSEPANPAWSDLNANGSWYDLPGQGYVWSPHEASNPEWDPYGSGYWLQEPTYGYIWVSGYPWGYMPYQCGMWNYYDAFGWGWAPGNCRPWWGGVWVVNIDEGSPRWYPRPVRPRRPLDPRPGRGGVRPVGPEPVIPVSRRVVGGPVLPPREKGGPVRIGGNTVQPLQPRPVRPSYEHLPGMTNRPEPVSRGNGFGMRSGDVHPPETGNKPVPPPNQHPRPVYAPAPVSPHPVGTQPRVPEGGGHSAPPAAPRSEPAPTHGAPAPHSVPAPSGPQSGPR